MKLFWNELSEQERRLIDKQRAYCPLCGRTSRSRYADVMTLAHEGLRLTGHMNSVNEPNRYFKDEGEAVGVTVRIWACDECPGNGGQQFLQRYYDFFQGIDSMEDYRQQFGLRT